MPITYSEITSGVINRARWCSSIIGDKLYMPHNEHAGIGVLDLTNDTYSEITSGVVSRTRWQCYAVGTTLYMPSRGSSVVMGKLNTLTDTYSEVTIGGTRNWNASAMVGSTIYLFSSATANQIIVGRFNTSNDTYAEAFFTPPGPAATRLPRTAAALGNTIHLAVDYGVDAYVATYDTVTNTFTTATALGVAGPVTAATTPIVGTSAYFLGRDEDLLIQPAGTITSLGVDSDLAYTAVVTGPLIWWPFSDSILLRLYDTRNASVADFSATGMDQNRQRITSAWYNNKLYMPHNGHASIGVLTEIMAPITPTYRPRRGHGLRR